MMISMQHIQMGIYSMHTYIHTYIIIHSQGVSHPPHPMGGVGTRDTEPYIHTEGVLMGGAGVQIVETRIF